MDAAAVPLEDVACHLLLVGRIAQKKKRSQWYVLTLEVLEEEDDPPFDDDEFAKEKVVPPTQVVYISKTTASSSSHHDFSLYIHSIIRVTGHLVDRLPTLDDHNVAPDVVPLHRPTQFFLVEQWHWIQCPPNLRVIAGVLQILRRSDANTASDLTASVLVPYNAPPEYEKDQVQRRLAGITNGGEPLSLSQLQHWILRGLQGREVTSVSRQRRPRASRADRELLQRLHNNDAEMEPRFVPLVKLADEIPSLAPRSFAQPASARGSLTRHEYMQRKKAPQVQWLVQRVLDLLSHDHREGDPVRILDIGGGRGDMAVQLVLRLGPQARITVVDRNPLTACQEWATQQGVPLTLRSETDFFTFMEETPETRWDCVVAWHACGDLTDAALWYAQRNASACIICPCCYNKSSSGGRFIPPYYQAVVENELLPTDALPRIQRLAETSQDAATSRRAALWIDRRRIMAADRQPWWMQLEEFSSDYSARNLVLVGRREEPCP